VAINDVDIKKLFGLSAGQCNICKRSVIEGEVVVGEMAHIIAKSSKGPRGDGNNPRNDTYDNLILLCSIDHKKIDSRPMDYSVQCLLEIKAKHETDIADRLNRNNEYEQDLSSLNALFEFIPFLALRGMVMGLPYKLSLRFEISEPFNNFRKGNPQSHPFWNNELTQLWDSFLFSTNKLDSFIFSSICGEKIYSYGEFGSDCRNYDIYVGDDIGHFMFMNKRYLSQEQIGLVEQEVSPLVQNFIDHHTVLVQYIRYKFKDIKW